MDGQLVVFASSTGALPRQLVVILLLAMIGLTLPLNLESQSKHILPFAPVPASIGLLMTTNDLLFDVDSYGGGIGLKMGRDPAYLRLMLDLSLSTAGNACTIGLGATYERHLASGAVSPYWGISGAVGFETLKDEDDSLNWLEVTAVPVSATGLLGVELFLADNISLFLEYALALELTVMHTATSVSGVVSRDTSLGFEINTGLANQSKIGVTIYLPSSGVSRRAKTRTRDYQ